MLTQPKADQDYSDGGPNQYPRTRTPGGSQSPLSGDATL